MLQSTREEIKKIVKEAIHEEMVAMVTSEEFGQLVLNLVNSCMTRKITVEYGPRKQGDPEKVIKEEDWNILDWLVRYMPYNEGALRGMQEDLSKAKNTIMSDYVPKLDAIGQIILAMENTARYLAEVATVAKALGPMPIIEIAEKTG